MRGACLGCETVHEEAAQTVVTIVGSPWPTSAPQCPCAQAGKNRRYPRACGTDFLQLWGQLLPTGSAKQSAPIQLVLQSGVVTIANDRES